LPLPWAYNIHTRNFREQFYFILFEMVKNSSNIRQKLTVTVDSIGAQGDGVATGPNGRFYIPFAAPEDQLSITPGRRRGDGAEAGIVAVIEPSPDRAAPVCRHFEICGGCVLQHISGPRIAAEKKALLTQALARRGLENAPVADTVTIPPGARRRVRFALHNGQSPAFGFRRRNSRFVMDMTECPVTRSSIVALAAPIRALIATIPALGASAEISVTDCDSGLDVLLAPSKPSDPSFAEREALAGFAARHDLARLSWDDGGGPEPIAARRDATAMFADTTVALPAGSFLQPTAEGEAAIARLVVAAADQAKSRADLFSGCGALSFPLLSGGPVHAFEGDAGMVAAARRAVRQDSTRSLTASVRDLARDPLNPAELNRFDAVVFDPPRAGAAAQSRELAMSGVPTVIAVSCNPATLARDLRTLVEGGYRIELVTPIDQFAWSAHIEAVAVLRRP
jgi:23S rRNA (uracil1939-C5)-methyltransferase